MLQTLGSLLMVAFLLAYIGMCVAFFRKHTRDLQKDLYERLQHENLSHHGNPIHKSETAIFEKTISVLLVRDRRSQQLTTE